MGDRREDLVLKMNAAGGRRRLAHFPNRDHTSPLLWSPLRVGTRIQAKCVGGVDEGGRVNKDHRRARARRTMNRTSAIALSVAVAIITYYFPALLGGGASSVASPGAVACKRTGFLGLRCAGAGCVRRGMKCTLSSVGAQAKAPVSTSSADALMRKRSVDSVSYTHLTLPTTPYV